MEVGGIEMNVKQYILAQISTTPPQTQGKL
jgi:hypothetical protein